MSIGIVCSMGSGLVVPANILIFGNLVGSLVDAEMIHAIEQSDGNFSSSLVDDIMEAVTTFAIGNSIIGVVMLVLSYISIMIFNLTSQRQSFRIRTTYLRSILHQDISWYDVMKSGDVASRLTE